MKKIILTLLLLFTVFCNAQNTEIEIKKELNRLHIPFNRVTDSIAILIRNCNEQIQTIVDPIKKERLLLRVDTLWNISDKNDIEKLRTDIPFAKKHLSSLVALQAVRPQVSRQPGKDFYEDFKFIYDNASKEVQESESGKLMAEQLKYFKKSMVGSLAPAFSGKDIFNQEISLSDFKGHKYVLIDFWASWCGPCRGELPYLKNLHEKYNGQGFEIISISIDEDISKWKNAILKENIEKWKHFSTIQNNSPVNKDYFVYGIPHKVLIDKNGFIIGKWKASGELNKKSLQDQLTLIFGY
ncbi:MAG: TlpA family protein disulfide reductase [Flavobacterium sp.]